MALDAVIISAVSAELSKSLPGARIDRIQQPDRDLLIFTLRTSQGSRKLLISSSAASSRIHYTSTSSENPASPPMFCMLLRKYLTGARIESVSQPDWERLILIGLSSRNELGDRTDLTMAVELMGKNSNLVLVGQDGRIIDCMRRTGYAGSSDRCLNPGMFYRLPPKQNKPCLFSLTQEELSLICPPNKYDAFYERLSDSFSCLSPGICSELEYRIEHSKKAPAEVLSDFAQSIRDLELTPLVYASKDKMTCSAFALESAEADTATEYQSFSEMLDSFYAQKDALEHKRRLSRNLLKNVRTNTERIKRKLQVQYGELVSEQELEKLRRNAEYITANIYRIRKGDREVVCDDYYCQQGGTVTVSIDPLKTPQQNSAALYKLYTKKKTALHVLEDLIAKEKAELDYLLSVEFALTEAESYQEISEISHELKTAGYIKENSKTKPKAMKTQPPSFTSSDGFEIYVGRNNLQNEFLTFSFARRTDLWLHVKNYHGSHVIISCLGREPTETAIKEAAEAAAFSCEASCSGKLSVDYTMVRNVKKPSGAYPGNVIYTDYKSISVNSDVNHLKS